MECPQVHLGQDLTFLVGEQHIDYKAVCDAAAVVDCGCVICWRVVQTRGIASSKPRVHVMYRVILILSPHLAKKD